MDKKRYRIQPTKPLHVLLIVLALLCVLGGCTKNNPQAIIGTWRLSQSTETLEFQEDGTLLQTDASGNVVTWNYTFVDDTSIKIYRETATGDASEMVMDIDIRLNQMMITQQSADTGMSRTGLYERILGK